MPPAVPGPILRRRRLGAELRRLREAAGLTGEQVIARVGWASASKLSRLENGRSRPHLRDVLALLDVYQAPAGVRECLTAITRDAGDMRGWLRSYPVMTARQRGYAELEAGCAEIREYSGILVPGLLQTPGYARLRLASTRPLGAGGAPDTEAEVAARLARQSLLHRPVAAPGYTAILDEAALDRRAGPPELLREQRNRLCAAVAMPNVTLHLLPRDAVVAEWYLPPTPFSLYRFPDPLDPETLVIEGDHQHFTITENAAVERYELAFEWLRAAALSATETLAWLRDAAGGTTAAPGPSTGAAGYAPAPAPGQRTRHTERLPEP